MYRQLQENFSWTIFTNDQSINQSINSSYGVYLSSSKTSSSNLSIPKYTSISTKRHSITCVDPKISCWFYLATQNAQQTQTKSKKTETDGEVVDASNDQTSLDGEEMEEANANDQASEANEANILAAIHLQRKLLYSSTGSHNV